MKNQYRSLLILLLGLALAHLSHCQSNAMQIETHYKTMDDRYASSADKDKYLFSKQIMIRVVKYYSAAMTVKTAAKQYSYTPFTFDDGTTLPAGTFDGHLFTVFDCYNKPNDKGFAAAAFQDLDPANGRPISGIFQLNLNAIKPSPKNALAHYGTFVHEFYHIMTFNKDLFQYFRNSAGGVIGQANIIGTDNGRQTYILGGEVLKFAKAHLSDDSLAFVTLENGGGAGSAASHWEYDFWPNDFMSPIDTLPSLLSPLSLYMSKDAGWYDVNDNFADPLIFGRGAGANFQSTANCPGERSPQPLGFCAIADKEKGFCSPDGMFKGACNSDETYNNNGGCPFIMGSLYCTVPSSDYDGQVDYNLEKIGPGSRCATVKTDKGYIPACATTSCSSGSATFEFVGSNNKCTCTAADAGSDKSCGGWTVKCPSAVSLGLICDSLDTTKQRCPNDCSGKGFCLGLTAGSKQCWCSYGWTGNDCSTANTAEPELTNVGTSTTPNKKNANIKAIGYLMGVLVMILASFL